ncbi:MAG: hypothetical protein ACYTHM_07535 [Planctomycetota bacterium]|jgi:hypothetical protein
MISFPGFILITKALILLGVLIGIVLMYRAYIQDYERPKRKFRGGRKGTLSSGETRRNRYARHSLLSRLNLGEESYPPHTPLAGETPGEIWEGETSRRPSLGEYPWVKAACYLILALILFTPILILLTTRKGAEPGMLAVVILFPVVLGSLSYMRIRDMGFPIPIIFALFIVPLLLLFIFLFPLLILLCALSRSHSKAFLRMWQGRRKTWKKPGEKTARIIGKPNRWVRKMPPPTSRERARAAKAPRMYHPIP